MTKLHNFPIRGKGDLQRDFPEQKGCSLDTLALKGTNALSEAENAPDDDFQTAAVTRQDDRQTLLKRARRKYLTSGYVGALVDASELNRTRMQKSYWNTYHCARTLTLKSDGNITGRYCKNRWCLVCNSIRTARLIKRYAPELATWPDKHLVTLTIPNVEAGDLSEAMQVMNQLWQKYRERNKKRVQRGQSIRARGIRKLECTYNPERNDFHPHFHVLVDSREPGEEILETWIGAYNASFHSSLWGEAAPAAQDLRKADDGATHELFKYFTKVIQGSGKNNRRIYADAMDIIFSACKGRQVFKHFGFTPPPEIELTPAEQADAEENAAYALGEYVWNREKSDWELDGYAVDAETGEIVDANELLTGYTPGDALRELIDNEVIVRTGHSWKRYARPALYLSQGGQAPNEAEERTAAQWIAEGNRVMAEKKAAQRKRERARNAQQMKLI